MSAEHMERTHTREESSYTIVSYTIVCVCCVCVCVCGVCDGIVMCVYGVCECEMRKCAARTVKMIDRFIIMSSVLQLFSGGHGDTICLLS
jgi:hypothetical protein